MSTSEYLSKQPASKRSGLSVRRLLELARLGMIRKRYIRDPKSRKRLAVFAADSKSEPVSGAAAAFSRIKSLVGEWQADTPMGKSRVTYELVSSGTAVLERDAIGDMPPMITLYYLDGNRLLLTHYCMVGNQPRMRSAAGNDGDEVVFEFAGGANLNPATDVHMHDYRLRFAGTDRIRGEWELYKDGKSSAKHAFDLVRKK